MLLDNKYTWCPLNGFKLYLTKHSNKKVSPKGLTHVKSLIETHLLSCVAFNSEIPKNPIRIAAIV